MSNQQTEHPKGLTVSDLRKILDSWEAGLDGDGCEREVFIQVGIGLSSVVTAVWPLGLRDNGSDILLCVDQYES